MKENEILGQYNLPQELEKLYFQTDILSVYNAQNNAELSYFQNANPLDIAYTPPIHYAQPDVEEIQEVQEVRLDNNYAGAMENIARIAATSEGAKVMSQLIYYPRKYTLRGVFWTLSSGYNPKDGYIYYVENPSMTELFENYGGGAHNSMTAMGHEMHHAYDHSMGEFRTANYHLRVVKERMEPRAVSFENYLRKAYSLSPLRVKYNKTMKGNFHQIPCHETISDFKTLGHNDDETAYGFSYTKTTTIFESYTPLITRTEITNHFIIVYRDKNKNNKVSYKIFNDVEAYNNATSKW